MNLKTGLIIFTLLFLASCNNNENVCDKMSSPVKSIGGCDKYGDCGVLLEDGTALRDVRQPIIGVRPRGSYCSQYPL
jgi:hypothetical protein